MQKDILFQGLSCDKISRESARQSLLVLYRGGKSGLHRVKRQITSGKRELTESATENIPPRILCEVRVKRCGKSAPRNWQQLWQGKPRLE